MAYDSVRAQLDKLLGVDRNGPLTESASNEPLNYRDAKFCKHYLLGFCPNDLYIKQRSEPGSCRLEHSEAAKSAFEKDHAEGRVREEDKFRWMRALLNECRTIVAEEDRKIRGQARRLQESYGCGGTLAGLMIRNFDTLKKLGMVSQNAKIRVLSEIDDHELLSDDDATLLHVSRDHSADATVDSLAEPESKNVSDLSKQVHANSSKDAHTEENNDSGSDSQKESGEQDDDDDDDDDDDLDGFGLIKVIPAGDAPEEKFENLKEKGSEMIEKAADAAPTNASISDNSSSFKKEETVIKVEQVAGKGKKGEPVFKNSSDLKLVYVSKENDNKDHFISKNDMETDVKNSSPEGTRAIETKNLNGENLKPNNEGKSYLSKMKPVDNKQENNVMDKFYETGIGPDGLLMLDRKQSKRVCACCGGYISLVDAESRLLSHYGGKSHHSLAQLRAKIPEIEAELAKAPRFPYDSNHRGYGRHDERDYGRSRNNDDWRSRGDHRGGKRWSRHDDRYRGSQSSRNQHYSEGRQSGGEKYSSSRDIYSNRYGSRYKNDDYDNERSLGRSDRYHSRRKRHRSPSPHRGSRRRRRHY